VHRLDWEAAVQTGFFASLFDLSFTSFVTTKLIKVLYILSLVLLGLGYIVIAIALFSSGGTDAVSVGPDGTLQSDSGGGNTALGLLWLFIGGPLVVFFYTLVYRVLFELVIVVFRIFENTRDQLAVLRAAYPGAAAPPAVAAAAEPVTPAPTAGPPATPPGPSMPPPTSS
jgi:hypothetical protein